MNDALPPDTISEDDIAFLDAFLRSDASPEKCFQVSDLDGFLTGIVVGPELILPGEWLAVLWGKENPSFKDQAQAEQVLRIIMGRYNEIIRVLDTTPDEFSPWFWEDEGGTVIASDWAEGFRLAVELRLPAWQPLLNDESGFDTLIPITAFWPNQDGNSLLDGATGNTDDFAEALANRIPQAVMEVRQYWRDHLVQH